MKAIKNNKGIIMAIIIFIFAIGIYKLFFSTSAQSSTNTTSSVGKDVLDLNANLQTVTLDRTLFGITAYKALIDFSTPIPLQTIGRHNPFSPIGSDAGQK